MTAKMIAPLGKCVIVANTPDGKLLVMYSKRDFTPEQWARITPANGPCVYREYAISELREIADDLPKS